MQKKDLYLAKSLSGLDDHYKVDTKLLQKASLRQ